MKIIFGSLAIYAVCNIASAQSNMHLNSGKDFQYELKRYDDRIYKMLKKKYPDSAYILVHQYYIFGNPVCLRKKEFQTKSFFNDLYIDERTFKRKTYIDAQVFVIDSINRSYAKGNAFRIGNFSPDTVLFSDYAIIQAALHDSIDYIVHFFFLKFTFGIKGNDVLVFKNDYATKTVFIYRLEDFIECCWSEFLGQNEECPMLKLHNQ